MNDNPLTSADADALAADVDPEELGLDEDSLVEEAEHDPEATP
jgi:hypothetical protein